MVFGLLNVKMVCLVIIRSSSLLLLVPQEGCNCGNSWVSSLVFCHEQTKYFNFDVLMCSLSPMYWSLQNISTYF